MTRPRLSFARSLFARPLAVLAAGGALAFLAAPAQAELPVGAKAPLFATQGALAGKAFGFSLAEALKKGPVVLYFYPKAFTQGCTLEAHAFAEAINDFQKAGATVIGMSADNITTLQKFSTEECRDKFPVGVADARVIKDYDVALSLLGIPASLTKRTSYVIGRDGRIKLAYTDMDYRDHVARTLAAVRALK
ncbi:MAG TPA: peroxiredoxin [Novosphingobium sp.]|nr:peroxiredoxin [Novosphingobium sp.]